ncbi:hypothetical protein QWZ10_16635 [Paracoccus cavernae]|uniref:Oligopeptide transport permease C-like N-terminal domain-containing protein n=1 Tax=Paracoccus cavernae TaxID=1571207 RepID=A0ABT8D8A6_9RHOB|nr:hypothetical protein [Paracoccus cavernae]
MRLRFNFLLGLTLVTIAILGAVFAGLIAPYDPIMDADLMNSEMPPAGTTGWAPTGRAATCFRGCFTGRRSL